MSDRLKGIYIDPNTFLDDGEILQQQTQEESELDKKTAKSISVDPIVAQIAVDIGCGVGGLSVHQREKALQDLLGDEALNKSYTKQTTAKGRSLARNSLFLNQFSSKLLRNLAQTYIESENFDRLDSLVGTQESSQCLQREYKEWKNLHVPDHGKTNSKSINPNMFVSGDNYEIVDPEFYLDSFTSFLSCSHREEIKQHFLSKKYVLVDRIITNYPRAQFPYLVWKCLKGIETLPEHDYFLNEIPHSQRGEFEKYLAAGDFGFFENHITCYPSAELQYIKWKKLKNILEICWDAASYRYWKNEDLWANPGSLHNVSNSKPGQEASPNVPNRQPQDVSVPKKVVLPVNSVGDPSSTVNMPKLASTVFKSANSRNNMNILVLGETGVGKSTFINGLANYLKYESMEEALQKGVEVLIESSFSLTDDKYNMHHIKCVPTNGSANSSGSNECNIAGQSATQDPRAYTISCGPAGSEKTIRIIDTPGFGDKRGIEQDQLNFQKILQYISKFSEIHAVCILVKPNSARLTHAFRFCIDELLVHLHKSASKNILFCFTNTRGTLYKPGDTLPTLREHLENLKRKTGVEIPLNKSTVFCFDNESFRFLCARQHNFPFDPAEIANFQSSWKQAVDTSGRLFARVAMLEAHSVRETLSLNNIRNVISSLTRPLGEMAKNLVINKKLIDDKIEETIKNAKNAKNLKGLLYSEKVVAVPQPLEKPQTVCTSVSCVEILSAGSNSTANFTNYKTVCHENCSLSGIQKEFHPDERLKNCFALKTGTCEKCGCSWEAHMHIDYRINYKREQVVSPDVQASIKRMENANDILATWLDKETEMQDQMEQETRDLIANCAEFAVFMQSSSMISSCDAFGHDLENLLKEKADKVKADGGKYSDLVHNKLNEFAVYYTQQKCALEDQIRSQQRMPKTLQEMDDLIKSLNSLKYCGPAHSRFEFTAWW